jgi:hypothetical protein
LSGRKSQHLSAFSADRLKDTARRIEGWLLDSGVQLRTGFHRGGVAGWLDRGGRSEFVYLEITGYYLTMAAWLASGAASSIERRAMALEHGRRAVDWMKLVTADGAVPPTRLYFSPGRDDWRNAAIFVFDLAMALRGVSCFAAVDPTDESATLVRDLVLRMEQICAGSALLPSHALGKTKGGNMPDRWSTRPGPHHVKAAAALLRLPEGVLSDALTRACRDTVTYWAAALQGSWPCSELHALLYGLEGLVIQEPAMTERTLDSVKQIYERLLRLQAADGSMPSLAVGESRQVRSDVLAQALRVGALLRAADRLQGEDWQRRLDALAAVLLSHVREDGGVLFAIDEESANTWCAMFTHQALLLHACANSSALARQEAGWLV